MSEDEDESWVALTAEWPVQVLAGLLDAVSARLEEVSEGAICDHCLLIFPVWAITRSAVGFPPGIDRDIESVPGEAVLTNVCSQCYRLALKQVAMQRLAPLFDGMRGSVTTLDLSSLLGGALADKSEDDRPMGQYL